MTEIIYKEESYKLIGACMQVHRELGPGFLEAVYQEALEKEFIKQGIPYNRESRLTIFYNGQKLKKYYVADFLCYDKIVVETKASKYLVQAFQEQLVNNLRAVNLKLGLLVNFGQPSLVYKRYINVLYNSL